MGEHAKSITSQAPPIQWSCCRGPQSSRNITLHYIRTRIPSAVNARFAQLVSFVLGSLSPPTLAHRRIDLQALIGFTLSFRDEQPPQRNPALSFHHETD